MKIQCPRPGCLSHTLSDPNLRAWVRKGFFYRRSDRTPIRRYKCLSCKLSFSSSTCSVYRYEKKRFLHPPLFELYSSGVSQRRLARVLNVNPKTVVRMIRKRSQIEKRRQRSLLDARYRKTPLLQVQFDDLETSVHTKCKPVSVTLAVEPETRTILAFQVSQMPAKGHLAEISRRKYGPRRDQRPEGWARFFQSLTPYVKSESVWTSDENPHYPKHLKRFFPNAVHRQTPGGRGAVTGQGELKKLHYDPLFSLNHTCAMLRANMNRLFRRTWCTTKKIEGLIDHLWIYIGYHNRVLTRPVCPLRGGS
jgi:transposase-like protein